MENKSLDQILSELGVSMESIEGFESVEMGDVRDRPDRDVGH